MSHLDGIVAEVNGFMEVLNFEWLGTEPARVKIGRRKKRPFTQFNTC